MTLPAVVDSRFRAEAGSSGLLDVAYDVTDSPLGPLFLAATERGLCRIAYDAEPEAEEELLARRFGARVLRAPRTLGETRRELDDYFDGRRRRFELPVDLAAVGAFQREVLTRLASVPYGSVTTYGALAAESGRPRAARAVGGAMNRNPVPIVLPCHRVVGSDGRLVGYGGGIERKIALLRLEGVQL
jgi:methylated-DNA-[protein]-cysteine S-methyltransferase